MLWPLCCQVTSTWWWFIMSTMHVALHVMERDEGATICLQHFVRTIIVLPMLLNLLAVQPWLFLISRLLDE